jgi:cytochrome c oxidase cbb3-type subunit III
MDGDRPRVLFCNEAPHARRSGHQIERSTEVEMTRGRRSSVWAISLILVAFAFINNPPAAFSDSRQQLQAASTTSQDVEAGRDLYVANCSGCHGADAAGGVAGEGPNIQRLPASLGDDAVSAIIKNGISGTGMPAFSQLTDAERTTIIAFIRTLTPSSSEALTGNPAMGKNIYEQNKCADCHIIDGQGGDLGPDLTNIGSTVQPDALRQALVDPGSDLPRSGSIRDRGKWKEYAIFRAVTKAGRSVEGLRIRETTFSIVLEDAQGNFHPLAKSDLRTLDEVAGKSLMPSYRGSLSAAQFDDLVAYLAGLGGKK